MPTPLDWNVSATDANMLGARPDHLAAIGLASANWATLEEGLQQFFQQLLSYQMTTSIAGMYDRDHPWLLANVGMILPIVESVRVRLDLITAVGKAVIPKPVAAEWEGTYVRLVRDTSGKRNTIVHGRWGYSDKYPKHLLLKDAKAKTVTAYTAKDILFIANEIRKASDKLSAFFLKCHHAYGDNLPQSLKSP